MTELLGKSVGEWSANQYANFGAGNIFGNQTKIGNSTRNCDALIPPNWKSCGISFSEWAKRSSANSRLKGKGLTSLQIAKYWKKFQNEVQSTFDSSLFISYAERQRVIDKVRDEEEDRLYEQVKAKEEKEIINDLNLFPPKPNNSPIPNELMGDNEKDSQPNYLVYGLIGLGVIIGGFLIFKKK